MKLPTKWPEIIPGRSPRRAGERAPTALDGPQGKASRRNRNKKGTAPCSDSRGHLASRFDRNGLRGSGSKRLPLRRHSTGGKGGGPNAVPCSLGRRAVPACSESRRGRTPSESITRIIAAGQAAASLYVPPFFAGSLRSPQAAAHQRTPVRSMMPLTAQNGAAS
jgi:hypothetical protein